MSLLADVTATYIGIRTTEQLIAIARDNIRRQEQALSIAKAKYQGGGTSELDVFQATNVLEQTRGGDTPTDHSVAAGGKRALRTSWRSAAVAWDGAFPVGGPDTIAASHDRGRYPGRSVRRRPDVRAAELAAVAQSAQIGVALTQLYPAISITGTFGGAASTANGQPSATSSTGRAWPMPPVHHSNGIS